MMVNQFTVLVVDDEQIVREYFATQFPWDQVGMRWIGDAADGRSALEKCRRMRPDLVLADISMPGMDGLQLLEHLGRDVPYANCVLLTCHQDFDYVQTALRLGAIDYILKAVTTPKEMVTKLQSVRKRIEWRQKQARLKTLQRQWLAKLLLEGKTDRRKLLADLQRLRLPLLDQPLRVLLIRVEGVLFEYDGDMAHDEARLSPRVEAALDNAVEEIGFSAWTSLRPGIYALVATFTDGKNDTEAGQEAMGQAFQSIQAELGKGNPVSGGLSGLHPTILGAPGALEQAEQALSCLFNSPANELMAYCRPWQPVSEDLQTQLDRLVKTHLPPRAELVRHHENVIGTAISLCREYWIDPQETRMLINSVLNSLARNLGCELSVWDRALWPIQAAEVGTATQLHDWAMQTISTFIVSSGQATLRPEIQKVVDRVRADISQSYDLTWAADQAGYHPNYFGTIFRNETGQPFMEYLCRLRMERSAKLIREGRWTMQQVAEMVGVPNYRTFFNAFQRVMGASPTEFADRFRSRIEA